MVCWVRECFSKALRSPVAPIISEPYPGLEHGSNLESSFLYWFTHFPCFEVALFFSERYHTDSMVLGLWTYVASALPQAHFSHKYSSSAYSLHLSVWQVSSNGGPANRCVTEIGQVEIPKYSEFKNRPLWGALVVQTLMRGMRQSHTSESEALAPTRWCHGWFQMHRSVRCMELKAVKLWWELVLQAGGAQDQIYG